MSAPPGYSSETILEIPKTRRPILPIQGGGALCAPSIPYTGIALATNSCYMNAGIQLLYSMDSLRNYFSSVQDADIDAYKASGTDCTDAKLKIFKNVLRTLKALFAELSKGGKIEDAIQKDYYDILVAVNNGSSSAKDYLKPFAQEDSQEFVSAVLGIFTCIPGVNVKGSFTSSEISSIVCKDTNILPVPKEVESKIISLALPNDGKPTSMQKSIEAHQTPETFTAGNNQLEACAVKGSKTGEATSKTISIRVSKDTENVLIQLKRYGFVGTSSKLDSPVYLNRTIKLQERDGTADKDVYFELKGIVHHHGSTVKSGHYTYLVVQDGRICAVIDDSRVLPQDIETTTPFVKVSKETLRNGYLFLYTRSTPDNYVDDAGITNYTPYPMDAEYTVNGSVIDLTKVTGPQVPQGPVGGTGPQGPVGGTGPQGPVGGTGAQDPVGGTGAQDPQGPQVPQGPVGGTGATGTSGSTEGKVIMARPPDQIPAGDKFPLVMLNGGFYVRKPTAEGVKEKITALDFNNGEKVLFNALKLNKPFIKKYITLNNANKDRFFEFWKTYIELDGTLGIVVRTKKEADILEDYPRELLAVYLEYLSNKALTLIEEQEIGEEDFTGGLTLKERSSAIKRIIDKNQENVKLVKDINKSYDNIHKNINPKENYKNLLANCNKVVENARAIYKDSGKTNCKVGIRKKLLDKMNELTRTIFKKEDLTKTPEIAETSLKANNVANEVLEHQNDITDCVKDDIIIDSSVNTTEDVCDDEEEEDEDYECEDELEDEGITNDDPDDDEETIRKKAKRNSPIPTCKTRVGRQTTMHTGKEFFEAHADNYEPYYIINTIKRIMTQRYGCPKKETSDKVEILLDFLLLKFPVGDIGDKNFMKAMQCGKKISKCFSINNKKKISYDAFLREIKRETPLNMAFNSVINTLIILRLELNYMIKNRYELLKDRIVSSDEKDTILTFITPGDVKK